MVYKKVYSGIKRYMVNEKILLCLAHMSGKEQQYIQEAFDTNWIVPLGPNVNGFEDDIRAFLGENKEVVALSSGTAAIHLALVYLGVKAGDEVMVQSFTFCASANPVVYQGATPVFVDSEPDTWNMDPQLLDEAIQDRIQKTGKKPAAIITVSLYGMPAKMDELLAVSTKYDIPLIEDSAEGMGSLYKGRECSTFGHFGVLSFNGNKMITTSGGGALICPDETTKERIMFYATQAREAYPYYQHERIGYNYRMSNICAGIGRGQMSVLDEHVAHHKKVHQMYVDLLGKMDQVKVMSNPSSDFNSNYWLSTITLKGMNPDELRLALEREGIESRLLWKPLHLQPVFADSPAYLNGTSEQLFETGLCLPSGPMVTEDDVRYIAENIKKNICK